MIYIYIFIECIKSECVLFSVVQMEFARAVFGKSPEGYSGKNTTGNRWFLKA